MRRLGLRRFPYFKIQAALAFILLNELVAACAAKSCKVSGCGRVGRGHFQDFTHLHRFEKLACLEHRQRADQPGGIQYSHATPYRQTALRKGAPTPVVHGKVVPASQWGPYFLVNP